MVKKRLYLFVLFLFVSLLSVFAQRHLVEYELAPRPIVITEKLKNSEEVKYHNQLKLSVLLEFDHTGYTFKVDDKEFENLSRSGDFRYSRKRSALIIGQYYQLYYNANDNVLCLYWDSWKSRNPEVFDWILTNETAEINGYRVYKAYVDVPYISAKGVNRINNVVAWYCPDIPYGYSPLGYHGLPGLVLSLESIGNKYIAKKIVFNVSKEAIIPPKEYNKLKKQALKSK
ncbi:GLPGLI family protein [Capnocytophaga cynodegmi]|uniref:GLPGLI family protein n=1 Tax=Capnocytophaga cynodegmi TaxID=28189 RepID=UPI00385A8A38